MSPLILIKLNPSHGVIVALAPASGIVSESAVNSSHVLIRTVTQNKFATVPTKVVTSNNPPISLATLATHLFAATKATGAVDSRDTITELGINKFLEENTNSASNTSLPSAPSPSSELGYPSGHTSFSLTRTVIAIVVTILIFATIITLFLCVGMRGRGNTAGERRVRQLQGMRTRSAAPASTPSNNRREGVVQSPLFPPTPLYPPFHNPRPSPLRRSFDSVPSDSWSQTTLATLSGISLNNPFRRNQFQVYPTTDTNPIQPLQPPRFPLLTRVLFPEFPLFFLRSNTRTPTRPAESMAEPTQPHTIHNPNFLSQDLHGTFLNSNSPPDETSRLPTSLAASDPRHFHTSNTTNSDTRDEPETIPSIRASIDPSLRTPSA